MRYNSIKTYWGTKWLTSEDIERLGSGKVGEGIPAKMADLEFAPVYSTDPNSENRKFWSATPSGHLQVGTVNDAAINMLDLNTEYYIIITDTLPDGIRKALGL